MISDPSNHLDVRMARLEGSYEQLDKRLEGIERRLDRVEHRIDRFEDDVKARFNQLDAKLDVRFNVLSWLSGGFGLIIIALQVLGAVGVI